MFHHGLVKLLIINSLSQPNKTWETFSRRPLSIQQEDVGAPEEEEVEDGVQQDE